MPRLGRASWVAPGLIFVLLALMVLSAAVGRYPVPTEEVARILFTTTPFGAVHSATDTAWVVVEIVRLPRILEVTLCGIALAMAGAAMQGVFRNPLVGPEIVGVTAGASLGGVLGILLGWASWAIVGCAFGMGLLATVIAYGMASLARRAGALALVLAGLITGEFFAASLGLAKYLADPQSKLPAITYWLLGSFADATYGKVAIVAGAMLVGGTGLVALRWRINLLSLGEMDARTLGVDVRILRAVIVALTTLLVAAQVSVSGGVGFVGLVVPHFGRMLVGPEHTRLLPVSALLGGILTLALDDISRIAPAEIPIGLLTAFLGAPIFAYLFWRHQGRGWTDG
jgi:iron complex transport system permease protein